MLEKYNYYEIDTLTEQSVLQQSKTSFIYPIDEI